MSQVPLGPCVTNSLEAMPLGRAFQTFFLRRSKPQHVQASPYAQDQRAFDGMDVVVSIALVKKLTFFMVRFSWIPL